MLEVQSNKLYFLQRGNHRRIFAFALPWKSHSQIAKAFCRCVLATEMTPKRPFRNLADWIIGLILANFFERNQFLEWITRSVLTCDITASHVHSLNEHFEICKSKLSKKCFEIITWLHWNFRLSYKRRLKFFLPRMFSYLPNNFVKIQLFVYRPVATSATIGKSPTMCNVQVVLLQFNAFYCLFLSSFVALRWTLISGFFIRSATQFNIAKSLFLRFVKERTKLLFWTSNMSAGFGELPSDSLINSNYHLVAQVLLNFDYWMGLVAKQRGVQSPRCWQKRQKISPENLQTRLRWYLKLNTPYKVIFEP